MYASKGAIRVSINLTASHQEKTGKKWKEETTLNVPIKVGPVLMKSSVHALTRKYFATGISAQTALIKTHFLQVVASALFDIDPVGLASIHQHHHLST